MLNVLNPTINELSDFRNMGTYIYNLAYLQQTKVIQVPPFICIPNDTIYYSLGEETKNAILKTISNFKDNLMNAEQASKKIRNLVSNIKLPKDYIYNLSLAINKYLGAKQGDYFMVKNSYFWGDTKINDLISNNEFNSCVKVSYANIANAMLYAYSSIYSPEILDFMKKHNFRITFPKNNIIIQTLINTDVSCIVSPVNNKDEIINERLIMAKIGKNIVQDEKIIEHYHYNITDGQFFNDNLSEYELLSATQLQAIMQQSTFIFDKLYRNYPVNIKFIISNDNIYVLNIHQCNYKKCDVQFTIDGKYIPIQRKNVTSDLSFACYNDYENRVIKDIFYHLYDEKEIYDENFSNLTNLLSLYKNNVYYDTRRTSVLVKTLPFAQTLYPLWEKSLNLKDYNYRIEDCKSNLIPLKTKHKKLLKVINRDVVSIFKNIENEYIRFDNQFNDILDINDCHALYEQLLSNLSPNMAYKYINLVYLYSQISELKAILKKAKLNDNQIYGYINESITEKKTPLECEILELSNIAKENENLKFVLSNIKTSEEANEFIVSNNEFAKLIRDFLLKYGDLSPYFNKIEAINYKDNPCILINEILNKIKENEQINIFSSNPEIKKIVDKKQTKKIVETIKTLSFNKKMFEYYECLLNSKLRKLFLSLGKHYYQEKEFDDITDIVFLNLQELFEGQNSNFHMLVQSRKEVYTLNSRIPTFEKIIFNREKN